MIEPTTVTKRGVRCNAWIWVRATSTAYQHIRFNVEVIEPASFTYVALTPVEFKNNVPYGYTKYVVGSWRTSTAQQLLFRLSLFGASGPYADALLMDDLAIYCS